jgi:hypothetical protein
MQIGDVSEAAQICHRSVSWVYARTKIFRDLEVLKMKGLYDLDRLRTVVFQGYFYPKKVKNEQNTEEHPGTATRLVD